jgi:hypothetical protein
MVKNTFGEKSSLLSAKQNKQQESVKTKAKAKPAPAKIVKIISPPSKGKKKAEVSSGI